MKYIFDCRYEAGGTAKIEVDWESGYVWLSRNGGYQTRLADMPIDTDCLNCRFDFVTCTMYWGDNMENVTVAAPQHWERCIDHICPDPVGYRKRRREAQLMSVWLADIQVAFASRDADLNPNNPCFEEVLDELLDSCPTQYHPMSGRANFKIKEQK